MKMKKLLFLFVLFYVGSLKASNLELEWQHYTSKPALKTQFIDYTFLRWDQKVDFHKGLFYFDSHIQAEYSLGKSDLFYFNIPELYFFYKYDLRQTFYQIQSIELNVGRKIKIWSIADEYWDMDLWNPLSRWNPLHPKTNGLVGSFLTFKAEQWNFDFFLGALYLPNQNVKSIEKDGVIYSNSRWFSPLPNRVDTLNINIRYLTDRPFIFDILFQQSYLLNFKTWSSTSEPRYWMKWSIANKPVNHLFFVLNKTNLFYIGKAKGAEANILQNVTILPVRQRLLSAEWGLDYKKSSAVFTFENSKLTEATSRPKGWDFLYHRGSFTYFSALLKFQFSSKSYVQVAYLQSWFNNYDIRNVNFKTDKIPAILSHYKVLEGIGMDWRKEYSSSQGLRRIFDIHYRYSFVNKGAWLSLKSIYYITPKIYTSLVFDILGSTGVSRYFLDQFRHNDYFAWSLAYDF